MSETIPYLIGIIIEKSNKSNENIDMRGMHGDVKCFATLNFGDYLELNADMYGGIKKVVLDYLTENSLQEPEDFFSLTDAEKEELGGSRTVAYDGKTPSAETGEYSSGKMLYSTVKEFADDIAKWVKMFGKSELGPGDTEAISGGVLDISAEKNPDLYPAKTGDMINVVWTDENGEDTNKIPMLVVLRKKFIDGVPEGEKPTETEAGESGATTEDEIWGDNAQEGENGSNEEGEGEASEELSEEGKEGEEPENEGESENDEKFKEDMKAADEAKNEVDEIDGKKYDVFGNEIE